MLLLEGKQKEGLSVKIGRLTESPLFSVTGIRAKNLFQGAIVFPFEVNLFWDGSNWSGRLSLMVGVRGPDVVAPRQNHGV